MAPVYSLTPEAERAFRLFTEYLNQCLDRGLRDDDAMDAVAAFAANFHDKLPSHLRGGFNQRLNQFAQQLTRDQQTPLVMS